MSKNIVKRKILNSQPSFGGWCMTASVVSTEIMAAAGFDWVCIDLEHSHVNEETMQNMFIAIENKGAEPFARIAVNEERACKKVLDAGASGIIIPMIKSYQDVLNAISYVKYPPEGKRSFSLARATGYGDNKNDYFKSANDNIFLAIMIEHVDAIRDLDRIFNSRHIDAVMVGPYDLSGSMGIPGDFENKDFKEAVSKIMKKAEEHGIIMGIHEVHPTIDRIKNYIKEDFKFIACGIDTLFINQLSRDIISWTKG